MCTKSRRELSSEIEVHAELAHSDSSKSSGILSTSSSLNSPGPTTAYSPIILGAWGRRPR
ncbi:MAG TPA: hypothetical protein VIJ34_14710 [Acidimicrobiales bacterium]